MKYLLGFLLWLLSTSIVACGVPAGEGWGAPPTVVVPSHVPQPKDVTKMGPELRRLLFERGRKALERPQTLLKALERIPVTIRARRDITPELVKLGVHVRSVTSDDAVIIAADVPPAAIPAIIAMPEVQTIEATQPMPLAPEERDER